MKAMVLNELCSIEENKTPLELRDLPDPVPGGKEILVKVSACGVCHTELDEMTIGGEAPILMRYGLVLEFVLRGNHMSPS